MFKNVKDYACMSKKKFHMDLQHFARNKIHPTLSDVYKYNKSMSMS